jgi:hypothetical protein
MPASVKLDSRKLMELAVDVMRQSVAEARPDSKASPRVGAVPGSASRTHLQCAGAAGA